ncbi:MAG: hypothetical protein RBT60_11905 [Candidatus Krumholzibacteria bacterium]|nr:hypothetical protein [Candidatus Krumholzibacteria bacterium]
MRRMPTISCMPVVILLPLVVLFASVPTLAQTGGESEEFIARTGEIIAWAAELVQDSENQQARRIIQEAYLLHQQSQDLQHRGRHREAISLSQRARTAAQHAARLAREMRNQQERVRLRLERFGELRDQLLERVHEAGDERALRFVREADQQALRAQDQYRQGNFDLALNLLNAGEELLARATRLLFEGGGNERLDREIERTQALIERAREQWQDASDAQRETAADLLQSAREALQRAEDFRARQQPLRALHSLRLARQLASQAAAAVGPRTDPDAVTEQLARWDERAEQVAELVRNSRSRHALNVFERARHHRDQAGRRLAAGESEPALRQLRAAFNLLNEASDLAR